MLYTDVILSGNAMIPVDEFVLVMVTGTSEGSDSIGSTFAERPTSWTSW